MKRGGAKPARRRRLVALVALSVLGAVLSLWLVWIHYQLLLSPGSGSACNFGGYLDCDAVNVSTYSELLGVPIAYGGLVLYVFLGVLAGLELEGRIQPRALAYARGLGLAAVLYSVILAFVSAVIIQAVCLFCVALYLVNLGIAGLGWWKPAPRPGFLRTFDGDSRTLVTSLRGWPVQAALLVTIAVAVVLAWWSDELRGLPDGRQAGSGTEVTTSPPSHPSDPAGARLAVLVFSDFQCSFCKRAAATVNDLRLTYGDRVRFVFKHFPFDPSCNPVASRGRHRHACAAAAAAICAGRQGKFWQFHDEVFAKGASPDALADAAARVGLDVAVWRGCLTRGSTRERIERDIEEGLAAGVRSTPSFLVGDRMIVGARSYDTLAGAIEERLARRHGAHTSERP